MTVASVLDAVEEGAGGSRWPRILFWPSGSVRAGLSWRRWSSAAASFSSASRPLRPRAGAFGYGGGLDAARASTAGGVEGGETRERVGAGRGRAHESRQP